MKNKKYIYLAVTAMLMIMPFAIHSVMGQPPPPPPPPPPPAVIPIDGGLSLLLAGLGAYGVKRWWNSKK